tara:strand:+ start:2347 stop:2649 length:303 start_codon:yes stop_codon:yes gene_type:complete
MTTIQALERELHRLWASDDDDDLPFSAYVDEGSVCDRLENACAEARCALAPRVRQWMLFNRWVNEWEERTNSEYSLWVSNVYTRISGMLDEAERDRPTGE